MPGSIIVDGKPTFQSGVFVENSYANQVSSPSGQGIVAVVGEFPFLKQNTSYLSTSRNALEAIAPGEATLLRLSNVCYNPSRSRPGAPAGILLISPTTTTQATGIVVDEGDATCATLSSTIWGLRGNRTVITYGENTTLGGYSIVISNAGAPTETLHAALEADAITVDYTYPGPDSLASNTCYGLAGTSGGGTGTVSAECADGAFTTTFVRNVVAGTIISNAHPSWYPDGPVTGALVVTALSGASWNVATDLKALITGVDADGVPATETLTLAPTSGANYGSNVAATSSTEWLSVTHVTLYPQNGTSTFTGTVRFAGTSIVCSALLGQPAVADAILLIGSTKGYSASTGSAYAADILLTELDVMASNSVPATASASLWSFLRAINNQSSLVTAEGTLGDYAPPKISASTTRVLSGGSQVGATNTDWQNAFNELLYADVHAVVPFSTSATIHGYLLTHVNDAFGKYQNERTGFYGVTANLTYSSLATAAALINSPRMERVFDRPKIRQYQGATETMETYWAALAMAAASCSNRRAQLNGWEPRFEGIERSSTLRSPEMADALIQLGYCVFMQVPNRPLYLGREVTTWLSDNNAYKTEGAALRSTVDMQRFLRDTVTALVNGADSVEDIRGVLVANVLGALDRLVQERVITAYNPSSVTVEDFDLYYEVGVEYTPRGSKIAVKIKAQVTAPQAA